MDVRKVGSIPVEFRVKITGGDGTVDRFPDAVRLKDGRIMLTYLEIDGDQRFNFTSSRMVFLFSSDEGKTWGNRKTFFENDGKSDGKFPGYDFTRFSRLPDGRLVMVSGVLIREKGKSRIEAGWWETSDEGNSWETAKTFGFQVGNAYRIRALADGTWGMPVGTVGTLNRQSHESKYNNRSSAVKFYVSSDGGETWTLRSTLYDGFIFPMQLCEPDWVVKKDGTIILYTRDELGFGPGMVFTSKDNGYTWSTEPMKFLGHHISADIIEELDQPLICFRVCHHKWPPAVGAWWDDGTKWGKYLHIHLGKPAGRYHADVGQWVRLKDGRFLVPYSITHEGEKEVHVWVATFSLHDFVSPDLDPSACT
ncbi:MAG: sialidase family protein [Candidatus Bathyarchaeia archaeon]